MLWNLHRRILPAIAAALGAVAPAAAAQGTCQEVAARLVDQGWTAYRADSVPRAGYWFTTAHVLCPDHIDAAIGRGYVELRQGNAAFADSLFAMAIERDSLNVDAWMGAALAHERLGRYAAAVERAARVLELAPEHLEARALLNRRHPDWGRKPVDPKPRAATLQVQARTRGQQFEVPAASGWKPFYIRGVNLGVALPGRFPSQFPLDSARYAGWLDTLAAMGANAVRLYTILPPTFYRALRGWNLTHPDQPLWLIHGVWTELPPAHDFNAQRWKNGFRQEMKRVVDVIHGSRTLEPRRGHASGSYDADVSTWTLAYILGREWEPFAVRAFDETHPEIHSYTGKYLSMAAGGATDAWMAEACDYVLRYEVDRYNAIRPIAYTNWPTLDPLHHPTEPSTAEEAAWRAKVGRPAKYIRLEYENDAVSLDPSLIEATDSNPAGWFASYHAYPYYPDFMLYDTRYSQAASSLGPSNYFGYLERLRAHHAGIPLVVAEYGVPSSRGTAHLQPQGWHHGGHDEAEMARINARLTNEIAESGAAGSILFAWIDEWFKHNWAVIDLEIPAHRNPRWLNVMDAEQQYGIVGLYAGRADSTPVLGGDPERWQSLPQLHRRPGSPHPGPALHVGQDPAYVYLGVSVPHLAGVPFPWDSLGVVLALDTYRTDLGQHQLPHGLLSSEVGFEFLVDLESPERAAIRVIPEYNPYAGPEAIVEGDERGAFFRRPVRPLPRHDGLFDSLYVITNRARFGRDGTFFPARAVPRGVLRYGRQDDTSLADWFYDEAAGLLEIRIPWALLNVTDPSSRTVVYEEAVDTTKTHTPFRTTQTDGFRIGAIVYTKGDRRQIVAAIPRLSAAGDWDREAFDTWTWNTWEEPIFHQKLKPVYHALKALWATD